MLYKIKNYLQKAKKESNKKFTGNVQQEMARVKEKN